MSFEAARRENIPEEAFITVKKISVDFKIGGARKYGKPFSPRLRVVTEDSSGQRITVWVDNRLDDLFEAMDFKRLTDKRLNVLLSALPETLRIRKKDDPAHARLVARYGVRAAQGMSFGSRYTYTMHPDDELQWREKIMETVKGPGRFLPTGEWLKRESVGIAAASAESNASRSMPEIVEFYKSLGKHTEMIIPAFDHHYTAFIYEIAPEKKIAIVAAGKSHNADYVFDAKTPAWMEHASKTKLDILTHPDPSRLFLDRIVHSGNWQEKARRWLLQS